MSLLLSRSCVFAVLALAVAGCAALAAGTAAGPSNLPADYKGTPFADEKCKDGPQKIPGIVMCALLRQVLRRRQGRRRRRHLPCQRQEKPRQRRTQPP